MSRFLIAGIVTLGIAALLFVIFHKWHSSTERDYENLTNISLVDKMEKSGVPNFEFRIGNGVGSSLYDVKSKLVIVSFWASWCGPCVEEFPSMLKLVSEMKGDVTLIAISQDSLKSDMESFLKSFPESKNKNIHIIWDESLEIGKKYQVDRLPESFVVNSDMKLVRKISGSINWSTKEAFEFMRNNFKK